MGSHSASDLAPTGKVAGTLLRTAAMCLLLTVAACVSTPTTSPEETEVRRVLETAFENIEKRYATDVTIRSVSVNGLNGLAKTDSLLEFAARDRVLSLLYDERVLAEWDSPSTNDFDGWAAVTANAIVRARAEAGGLKDKNAEEVLKLFFRSGLAKLDRYTRYATPSQARNTRARREGFGGLGITIDYEDGQTSVRKVHAGTPAFEAGLKSGDVITHIGDIPLTGLTQRAVVGRLRGPVHSRADLTVDRDGAPAPIKISVVRAHIILPTVTSERHGDLLSIKISGFNQGTSRSLGKILAAAEREMGSDLHGIIMDLRSNPGGLLDQAVAVTDFFLNDGRIISTKGRHRRANQIFDASWGERVHKLPMVLLVNGRSASASEIVAAALRDRGRAVLVGASSFGKGSVQTIIRLPNGGELTLTWAHMIAPSGFNLQGHGVIPAICTSGTESELTGLMDAVHNESAAVSSYFGEILASRHAQRHDPDRARELCPPSNKERSEDVEVARYVLSHRSLYSRALKDGGPAIAQH